MKAVIQAIPTYSMSCLCLFVGLLSEIQKLMARFWWSNYKDRKCIHWQRWELLCHPNSSKGLGFKFLVAFNQAFLAKQGWRILKSPRSLVATVLKAHYFAYCTF